MPIEIQAKMLKTIELRKIKSVIDNYDSRPNFQDTRSYMSLRNKLVNHYLYPRDHIGDQVKAKGPQSKSVETYILKAPGGNPYAVVSTTTDRVKTLAELTTLAASTETIGVIALFDSKGELIEAHRRKYDSNKMERIPDIEFYVQRPTSKETRLGKANASTITDKLEDVLFEIHSAMRDIDGLHADAALEELCKLLYVKAFTEESYLTPSSESNRPTPGTIEEKAATIRGLYRNAIDYDLRVYRLKIPQYERSRGVFQEQIKLSSAALVKAYQLLEPYSLRASKADVKGRAFQKVLGKAIRSGMGQYFTPQQVCQLIVDVVKPQIKDLILDPFCGSGHFLSLSLEKVSQTTNPSSKEFHEFAFGKLHGIEKSDRMTRIAMTDMRLRGDGHSNIRCVDALLSFDNYPDIAPESFDIVLTNPPFGSLIGSEALSQLGTFELSNRRKNIPLEILGLERAIAFLRPGGKLGIVLPDSIFSADSAAHVREWIYGKLKVCAVVGLPSDTFSPFGANVKTSILFGRKWQTGEAREDDHKVCMVSIDSIGYDATGRPKSTNDLPQALRVLETHFSKNPW